MAETLRTNLEYAKDDQYAQQIAASWSGDDYATNIDIRKLNPRWRRYFEYFQESAIVYDFSFNVSETNNTNADFDIIRTVTRGTLSLGLKAGVDLSRSNIRTLASSDTFRGLLIDVENDYCEKTAKGVNFAYPITGKIGMAEKIGTFVDLTLFNGLVGKAGTGSPTTVDETEFVTKVSGSITPKAELTNALKAGSVSYDTSRTDKHKVIIGLSIPADVTFKPALITPRYVALGPGATPAQRQATEAVNQFIDRFEAGRPIINSNSF
ncbi:hypothetical protein CO661_27035 [Sinorhizobium fredii]|uniref:Uncharacterized protein n=1 Tax=Rhizobium fredii TaxID=380 RepID=A0A2A6LR00_RHIFR|nr:hypothetical protein CO661_27035 [Sinorhizobium fredii]